MSENGIVASKSKEVRVVNGRTKADVQWYDYINDQWVEYARVPHDEVLFEHRLQRNVDIAADKSRNSKRRLSLAEQHATTIRQVVESV